MKTAFILLSVLCFSVPAENPVDLLSVSGPLEFNQTAFNLAYTEKANEHYYIQEYLPEGEDLERFNQLLTIHLFDTKLSIKEAVDLKIGELTERRKTDAVCNYIVTKSPDGKEYIMDFLLGESIGDVMTVVEFNVYRYKQITIGRQKAVIVYAYSRRSYGNDIIPFLKSLKEDRMDYINQMISAEIPEVRIVR